MTASIDNLRSKVLRDPVNFLAFGFGTGLVPKAPGTAGSVPGLLLAWLTIDLAPAMQAGIVISLCIAGVWLCGESARRIGVHDHGGIVWDEICGMYLTALFAPPSIAGFFAAFVLFRVFDIVKPWPIRDLDHRMRGGAGIMLDDLVAALYAALLLAFYRWLMT